MRSVMVYITAEQLKALASGRNQIGGTQEEVTDIVIELVDGEGGLLIHDAKSLDEEGSGVWMDADGTEHASNGGHFVCSEGATKLEDKMS